MERPRPSVIAWAALAGGVALYDILAPQGETLSEQCDRSMETRLGRAATLGAIAVTAAHLGNMLPPSIDPFHQVLKAIKHH